MDGSGLTARKIENKEATFRPARTQEPCGYIVAEGPEGVRFCDAPAARGSSYCAHHRARCTVAPGTPEGQALAAALAHAGDRAPPAVDGAPPEELDETEPEDTGLAFDRPRGDAAEDAA